MGLSDQDIEVLLRLGEEGHIPDRASVIDIGAQQLSNSFLAARSNLERLGRLFGITRPLPLPAPVASYVTHGDLEHQPANAPPARDFWKWLGFDHASIDIVGGPFGIAIDLNHDGVPKGARGKYDLVTNFGTTEHIANQLNAFKVIHDLTAVNGVMVHNVPSQGMLNHGLVNYTPKLFWILARDNRYRLLYFDYRNTPVRYELPQNIVDQVASFKPDITERLGDHTVTDAVLIVVFQKVHDVAFVTPLDVTTGS